MIGPGIVTEFFLMKMFRLGGGWLAVAAVAAIGLVGPQFLAAHSSLGAAVPRAFAADAGPATPVSPTPPANNAVPDNKVPDGKAAPGNMVPGSQSAPDGKTAPDKTAPDSKAAPDGKSAPDSKPGDKAPGDKKPADGKASVTEVDTNDPAELLAILYDSYLEGPGVSAFEPSQRAQYFSPRVLKLLDSLDRNSDATKSGIIGRLGFDPVLDGTDDNLDNLVLSEPQIVGNTALATVSFTVEGQPSQIVYSFIKVNGQWRIDDIERISDISPWRLNNMLSSDG